MRVQTKSLPLFVMLAAILLPETAYGTKCDCCPCPCKCDCKTVFYTPTPACHDVCLNLGLIIDGSDSISTLDWVDMMNFLQTLAQPAYFTIGPTATEFGVVQFATTAQQELPFGGGANVNNLAMSTALGGIVQMGGGTSFTDGIKVFLNTTWPTRRQVPWDGCAGITNAALLITDGYPNIRVEELPEVYGKFKNELDDRRFGVAVGDGANTTELGNAVGDINRVYKIENYSQLITLIDQLLIEICKPPPPALNLTKCQCCCPPPVPVKFNVGPWTPSCGDEYTSSTGTSSLYMSTQ